MQEKDERKSRECNLVLFGVAESTKEDGKEREREDRDRCDKIFTEGVGLNKKDYQLINVYRLGKKTEQNGSRGGLRSLLVKLANKDQKWTILKSAKNLAKCRNELKKCIIVSDMTIKEREMDASLRSQLKEKCEKGETDWYIKQGRLVRRNF